MNKTTELNINNNRKINLTSRLKDILVLCGLGLVLMVAVWKVFYTKESSAYSASGLSENEQKVSRILQEIDGVGEANVMICESEDGVESVVVVCEGANNLQVVINVREAVAAALGTEEKAVKIYLKKE